MTDTLFIFFDQLEYTQENEIGESFDVSLYGDIIDADVGWALTSEGSSVQRHYHDPIEEAKKEVHPRDLFHERYWITSRELMSDKVRLRTGEKVPVEDYDRVLISQVVFHTAYIRYLEEQHPELDIIGVQDESLYEVWSLSPRLQAVQLEALRNLDGFLAEDPKYYRWVSGIVDETVHLPFPLPRDHYDEVEQKEPGNTVALGCAPFNVDSSHFHSNLAVLRNLRDRGYELEGEILGVRDWQRRFLEDLVSDIDGVTLKGFIDEDYHQYLTKFRLALNLTPRSSAGRCVADYAGTGVPCVGSDHNDLQERLFPETSINYLDTAKATDIAEKLLEDSSFRRETLEKARTGVENLKEHGEIERRLLEFIRQV